MEQQEAQIVVQSQDFSQDISKLAEAMAAAQGEMGAALRDSTNPHFKSRYADLASIVEAVKSPLSKNGIAFFQTNELSDGGNVVVVTMLVHKSGQWIRGRLLMRPIKNDPQGIGSAITYARRYALAAITGVAPDDDDGNAASGISARACTTPAFPNAALRKTFCDNVIKSFEDAQTAEELEEIARLNGERMEAMKHGTEHDVLGYEELRNRYRIQKRRIEEADARTGATQEELDGGYYAQD